MQDDNMQVMQDDNVQEWTLTTAEKKSVEERTYWSKGDITIVRIDGYRWGTYVYSGETAPEIDLDNPDGIEMNSLEDWEMWSLDDGWWGDWEFPEDMEQEEQDRLMDLFDNEWYEGFEGEGWNIDDVEVWLYGPLVLEKKDPK